jgi:hypothetical protein
MRRAYLFACKFPLNTRHLDAGFAGIHRWLTDGISALVDSRRKHLGKLKNAWNSKDSRVIVQ